jgi:hypothetical protein
MSLIFGDIDIEADHDFDTGDIFSFKGLIHFVLGFSVTLTALKSDDVVAISIGTIVGLVFIFGLYWIYKSLYKKLSQSLEYETTITDADAEVYYWDDTTQSGEVFVVLEGRQTTISIGSKEFGTISLKSGQKIKVSGTRVLVYKV